MEFMIRLFGEFVKKVEYQALDSDIQKEKLDIRSACRGNPPNPLCNVFRQSVEQESNRGCISEYIK